MTGQTIILNGRYAREAAVKLCRFAPVGAVCNIRQPRRTDDQNSKLWAMLSDISRAKPEGRNLPPEIWKSLFMQSAGFKFTWEPGLDGEGVVPVGFKSSRLSKAEFSDLIECILAYGTRHGVEWTDPALRNERTAA